MTPEQYITNHPFLNQILDTHDVKGKQLLLSICEEYHRMKCHEGKLQLARFIHDNSIGGVVKEKDVIDSLREEIEPAGNKTLEEVLEAMRTAEKKIKQLEEEI